MSEEAINTLANGILVAGVSPIFLFLIVYGFTVEWWKTAIGRMFIVLAGCLVIFGIVVALSLFVGVDYPGRAIVRLVGYSALFIGGWTFFITFLAERRTAPGVMQYPHRKR